MTLKQPVLTVERITTRAEELATAKTEIERLSAALVQAEQEKDCDRAEISGLTSCLDEAHKRLDAAGIPDARGVACDESGCETRIGHRIKVALARLATQEATIADLTQRVARQAVTIQEKRDAWVDEKARREAQEATIRQVEQAMVEQAVRIKYHAGSHLIDSAEAERLETYTDRLKRLVETLRAILPAEQTGEKPRCSRCHNWRERHPVTKNPGDDPLGQMECAEFV